MVSCAVLCLDCPVAALGILSRGAAGDETISIEGPLVPIIIALATLPDPGEMIQMLLVHSCPPLARESVPLG